jgi:hypothetical protein
MSQNEIQLEELFKKIYKTPNYTNKAVQEFCLQLFTLNNVDIENIKENSDFLTLKYVDSQIYNKQFLNFLDTCDSILEDKRISSESKYIKIYSSFSNKCYEDSFKKSLIMHLLKLKYISCYNHAILMKQLKTVILCNIKLIGGCDTGMVESYLPQYVRECLSSASKNLTQMSSSLNPLSSQKTPTVTSAVDESNIPTKLSLLSQIKKEYKKTNLILKTTGVTSMTCPINISKQELPECPIESVPEILIPNQSVTETTEYKDIIAKEDYSDDIPIDRLKAKILKLIVFKARDNCNSLISLYRNGFVSALDFLNSTQHEENINVAIDKNNLKLQLKNSLNSELAVYKAKHSLSHQLGIGHAIKSLGLVGAPLTLGTSIAITAALGTGIDMAIDAIYATDFVQHLIKSSDNKKQFIKSILEFQIDLFKEGFLIYDSDIESCEIQDNKRYNLFYTASNIQDEFYKKSNEHFDKHISKYEFYLYIYNLLCDTTKEQDIKFIQQDVFTDGEPEELTDEILTEKVNKLYSKLKRGTCADSNQVFGETFQRYKGLTENDQKNVLSMAIRENPSINLSKCTPAKVMSLFENFIKPYINQIPPTAKIEPATTPITKNPTITPSMSADDLWSSAVIQARNIVEIDNPQNKDISSNTISLSLQIDMDNKIVIDFIKTLKEYTLSTTNCINEDIKLSTREIRSFVGNVLQNKKDAITRFFCPRKSLEQSKGGKRKTRKLRKNKTKRRKTYRKRNTRRR